jgi:hypothetical protein
LTAGGFRFIVIVPAKERPDMHVIPCITKSYPPMYVRGKSSSGFRGFGLLAVFSGIDRTLGKAR